METPKGGNGNNNEAGKEKSEAIVQEEGTQHSDEPESNEEDSTDSDGVEISNDDFVVQVLARLDGKSYKRALYQDAGTIAKEFLLPQNLPWHSRTRLPQKITKAIPRDIDDLHAITHCQDELHAPFGDFQGQFNFGRYENGQSRGNYSNTSPNNDASAAARRSQDPGILELSAQIPLPSSIDSLMNSKDPDAPTLAQQWKAELLNDPNHAEMLSHLPYHWGKRDGYPPAVDQQWDVSNYGKQGDLEMQKLAESRMKSKAQMDLASSCRRKWNISMKVGGVSTRSTLFPPSSSINNTKDDHDIPENSRRVIRPMLCMASLPESIQFGKTVSTDKAIQMDKAGFSHTLGSYDCRLTDALLNPKKDSAKRTKQVEVGRTRLMYSNLIQGDEPSTRNRVTFNSLITGQRLDLSKCKRPTEVKVGVRLNGRIIMEEAVEELPSITKRKHSTRQAENKSPALKSHVQCPESRTDVEIDETLCMNLGDYNEEDRALERSTENGAVVYLEMGSQLANSDIDRNDIIASLIKFNQRKSQKKLKKSASSGALSAESTSVPLGGVSVIKKSNSPRFALVPLEDGLIRTVCLSAGNMPMVAVHQVIREVLEQGSGRRCSVCWSDEGSGKVGVLECKTCGLWAHSNCCLDKGEFSAVPSSSQDVKQCQNPNDKAQVDMTKQEDDGQTGQWQCAVCCRYRMKPRRNPKMPSRFVDGETYTTSNQPEDQDAVNRNLNTPGPSCALCIHRGGAMSPFQSVGHGPQKWAHDVCRVWSGQNLASSSKINGCSSGISSVSPLSQVCALCGTGGVKGQFNAGLTKCAARGCFVAFHPMCALLASKVGFDEKEIKPNSRKKRKTRHTDEVAEDKRVDAKENFLADSKLCKEYTLQLVQLTGGDQAATTSASEDEQVTIIPVAFCGLHNPHRDDSFFGCLPGGAAV